MLLRFSKYHGAGNDFILIDNRNTRYALKSGHIAQICDRHFGVGADGLIYLKESADHDFHMTYFNADGQEGTMCGNGGRCITAFANQLGLIGTKAVFSAVDGDHTAEIISAKDNEFIIRISMNDVTEYRTFGDDFVIDTGSPHFVRFTDDAGNIDVIGEGKKIRWDERFQPEGINVNFAQQHIDGLFVKTFERGVEDMTLSCGTGNTASALAAFLKNRKRKQEITVTSPGGTVKVGFQFEKNRFTRIYLEGPAIKVFEGEINI